MEDKITLAHGSGGVQTNELIGNIFKKHFANPYLTADDAAVLDMTAGKIAMSTEGKLSICGTVNDVACMGAKPEYLTCSFVIEEGFPVDKLEEIAEAMGKTAREAGVNLVAGDTKVAGKGQVDKIFITTTGIGHLFNSSHSFF